MMDDTARPSRSRYEAFRAFKKVEGVHEETLGSLRAITPAVGSRRRCFRAPHAGKKRVSGRIGL